MRAPTLAITICATAEHSQGLLAQAARVQANLIHWKGPPGEIIIAGDESAELETTVRLYEQILPTWTAKWQKMLGADYKRPTNHDDAMMVLARLRTEAFSVARIKDPDYVWSLDSDVLPPANALRCMHDMLQFDNGYYAVATCPYPNQSLIGGLGERGNPIYPGTYPDERKIPERLTERKKQLELAIATASPNPEAEAELKKIQDEITTNLNNYPAVGNVFARNALNGWKPRGWLDDVFPGVGKGAVVKVDWVGFGCNLINREALSYINWDGYAGGGTEDLFVCYNRWEQAGLNICAIPHVLCDHIKVNPGRPEEKIIFSTHHEIKGPMKGHTRIENHPYYQFQQYEPRDPSYKGRFLPKIERMPEETPTDKLLDKAYEIGLLQVRSEINQFLEWMKGKKIERVLEIGTDKGGLLWLLLHSGVAHVTSVDLPNGPFGTGTDTKWRNAAFDKAFPGQVRWVTGSSQDTVVMSQASPTATNSPPFDLLIVDGDHTKARLDYGAYERHVRPGGWVFFHDIKDTKHHRDQKVTVMDDWRVVRKETEGQTFFEFVDTTEEWGGIGIVQVIR